MAERIETFVRHGADTVYVYDEPFFYDGRTLFFGVPHTADCEKLFFDSDIVSLRTCASAVPRRYAHYDYVVADDKFLRFPSEDSVPGGNPLIDNIAHRSDRLFPEKGTLPSNSPVYTEFNLSDLTAQRGADAVGEREHYSPKKNYFWIVNERALRHSRTIDYGSTRLEKRLPWGAYDKEKDSYYLDGSWGGACNFGRRPFGLDAP